MYSSWCQSTTKLCFSQYLDLLYKEIEIINLKIIVTFGNQVSSIVLNKKISVSQYRKKYFNKNIAGNDYPIYPVFYPVGNGMMNMDKAIEDLNYIIKTELIRKWYIFFAFGIKKINSL